MLDISNNDNYVWTDDFIPPAKDKEHGEHGEHRGQINKKVLIAIIAGSAAGVILLSVIIGLILRKLNKNKRIQKKVIPGSEDEDDHENIHDQEQKGIPQIPKSVITKL